VSAVKRYGKLIQERIARTPAIHRSIRRIWTPPRSVYEHLWMRGPFDIEVEPNRTFRMIGYGYSVENELFWKGYAGSWEHASLALWRELCKGAEWIVDVGANTGVYALAAQALRPSAKVLAIEPSTRVFDKLVKNIRLNGFPIAAEPVALSDRSGAATFYDSPDEHQYSASLETGMGGTLPVEVPVARLDDVLANHGFPRVDLIKIDVERHEAAVLRGMRECLERDRPTILIEVLDDYCRKGIESALAGIDYRWELLADDEGRNYVLTPR
jgi:FkbM family methyltransferase